MASPYFDNQSTELAEELRLLNNSLAIFLDRSSPNLDLALQPTIKALDQISLKQEALRQEISAQGENLLKQQKVLDRQTAEIDRLKQQISEQNQWLQNNINWQTIVIIFIGLPIITAILIVSFQKFFQPSIDDTIIQKIDFIYDQHMKTIKKNKQAK
jgi:CHASE3 domain sensor protein